MDLATLAGVDYADITIGGHPFRIGELTQGEWAPVQAWIKATVPGPLSSLASPDFKRLPPDVKRDVLGHVIDKDRQSWPPLVGTRGWFLALDHEGGHAVALLAILRKHLPGITLDDCGRIVAEATFAEILPAFAAALGMFGPKSQAPPAALGRGGECEADDEGEAEVDKADDLGEVPFQFFNAHGWSPRQFLELTPRQVRYYASGGKVPEPGYREFGSQAEAIAWRREQDQLWAAYDWDGWTTGEVAE